jgi:GT2 family glycosyltransferase
MPADPASTLSVIVVTHDSEDTLPTLIASLPNALAGIDRHSVTIVDSGSTDHTVEIARRLAPSARTLELGWNAGYAAAINAAISERSVGGPVLVLNPDTRPAAGSLARLVQALDEKGTGITVPRLVERDGHTARSLRRRPTILRAFGEAFLGGRRAGRFAHLGEVVHDDDSYARRGTFDWATGAVVCISHSCIRTVGPWDESFFLYSEETDFMLRARDAGYTLRYVPDAIVSHTGGARLTSPELYALLAVNRVRCFRLRHGLVATAMFWLAIVLHVAIRAAAGSRPHRAALAGLFSSPGRVVATAREPPVARPLNDHLHQGHARELPRRGARAVG